MKRLPGAAAVLSGLLVVAAGPAAAQYPPQGVGQTPLRPPGFGQTGIPAYSPYLNLLRNGNSYLQNYYGLVVPQVNTMSALQNLQQQTYGNQQAIAGMQTGTGTTLVPPTGHIATFMNTSHYFMNRGLQGATGYGGGQMAGTASLNRSPLGIGGSFGGSRQPSGIRR